MTEPVTPPADPPSNETVSAREALDAAAPAAEAPAAAAPADLARRRFFREFAGEIVQTAATVVGAAQALQRGTAEMASAIVDPARLAGPGAAPGSAGMATPVFRTAFRSEGELLWLVDQRRLPVAVVEQACRSAAELTFAIREGIIRGAPAIGQAAAIGLSLTAGRVRASRPHGRRATLRGAANALRNTAGGAAPVAGAIDRVMDAYGAVGELSEDGAAVEAAMRAEADRIVAEATADHGALVDVGLAALPVVEGRPLRLAVHGLSGALAGGQYGTALAAVIAAHHEGREIHVTLTSGGPTAAGSRITAFELSAAGVPFTLVADAAIGSVLARGEIDAVLLAAERVAANGDVAAEIGAYPVAAVAGRHEIPVLMFAPTSTLDPATEDGAAMTAGQRPADELTRAAGERLAPAGAHALNPASDVIPHDLVSAIVTARGVLRPPFAFDAPARVGGPRETGGTAEIVGAPG